MIRLVMLLTVAFAAGALAEAQWTPPAEIRKAEPAPGAEKPRKVPVAAYGDGHPDCLEWTDGCLVCKRQEDGDTACSMPGVACLPAEPECRQSKP